MTIRWVMILLLLTSVFNIAGCKNGSAAGGSDDPEVQAMLEIGVGSEAEQVPGDEAAVPRVYNVLLLGDSISAGYKGAVAGQLRGVAAVTRGSNGGSTIGGLENIDKVLGETRWDVIHFNWGLHDMTWQEIRIEPEDRGIDQYVARLERLVVRLKETDAHLIWATTTPWCPEVYAYINKRFKVALWYSPEQEQAWKQAALKVMKRHDIEVNDLHALLLPELDQYLKTPDDIHFNGTGNQVMGKRIAEVIRPHLGPTDAATEAMSK